MIVLRIPGPTKYALHLQALLQQYLELRASHLLKLLEEQDGQGTLPHPPTNYMQHVQPVAYVPMVSVPLQQNYYQNHQRNHYYPTRHSYHTQQPHPQDYYNQAIRYQQNLRYQQQLAAYQQQQQQYNHESDYVSNDYDEPRVYVTNPPEVESRDNSESEVENSENYPSDKHTQAFFKKPPTSAHQGYHYSKPTAVVHAGYHHQVHDEAGPEDYYDIDHKEYNQDASTLSVTQRIRSPYNHHAKPSVPTVNPRNSKRDAPYTEEEFNKAKQIVRKMKRGSQRKVRKPKQSHQEVIQNNQSK